MFINIIIFIVALSIIVLIHELGHLLAAKKFNVYCYEFSIGMGPKIFSKKYKETVYSIRLLPLGGYVSMAGEGDLNQQLNEKYDVKDLPLNRTLLGVNKIKRIIIFLAGILFNFILAYLIFVGVILHNNNYRVASEPVIKDVIVNQPAHIAGLKANDYILDIKFSNGERLKNPKNIDQVAIYISSYGEDMEMSVKRESKILNFKVQGIKNDDGRYIIGILLPEAKIIKVDLWNVWFLAANTFVSNISLMFNSIISLFKGIGFNQISGPIGIYKISSEIAQTGVIQYIQFIGLFSINIGLINLLPIPALDGGRVMLLALESILGKYFNKKIENYAIAISMLLLLSLMVLLTFKDLFNLF